MQTADFPGADAPYIDLPLERITQWAVFHRLQELSIPCECGLSKMLRVGVQTPTSALQVWSVVQANTAPRQCTVAHLNRCWSQVL